MLDSSRSWDAFIARLAGRSPGVRDAIRLNKLWKNRGQLVFKRPWRIDNDQTAAAERTLRRRGSDRELCSQDAGDAAALEPARWKPPRFR